jgi:hypothetical protein
MADFLFLALTGKKPNEAEARPLQILIGLLISNGPGSITAQGAKGAVAADGPQTPGRVQINKALREPPERHCVFKLAEAPYRAASQ